MGSDETNKTNFSVSNMIGKHLDDFKQLLQKSNGSIQLSTYQNLMKELTKIRNLINDDISLKVDLNSEQQQQPQSDQGMNRKNYDQEGIDTE